MCVRDGSRERQCIVETLMVFPTSSAAGKLNEKRESLLPSLPRNNQRPILNAHSVITDLRLRV